MKIENNIIIEITVDELYNLYLEREMYEIMDFYTYKDLFVQQGTNIIEE